MAKVTAKELLVKSGIAFDSKNAEAKIMAGTIYYGDRKIEKAGELLSIDVILTEKGKKSHNYVSRGALKLKKVVDEFGLDVDNKICMDLGASTGGFSNILLNEGAKKIYAVDVGYNELDYRLRMREEIIVLERTNAKYIPEEKILEKIEILVCDVSFASATKIVEANLKFLIGGAIMVILIKPQFELPKEDIPVGAIVKDPELHQKAINIVRDWASKFALRELFLCESPIKGAKGNTEFLIVLEG